MSRQLDNGAPNARFRDRWRRTACVFAAVAVAASFAPINDVGASAGGHHARTIFVDHFSRTPDRAFTFVNRAGAVTGGKLVIDGAYLDDAIGRDGWALTHAGDARWRNYAMTAEFNTSNTGGSPAEVHMSMFAVRVGATIDTGYRILVWDPGQPDPRGVTPWLDRGLVQLFRVVDGEYTALREVTRSNTTTGWNRIRIAAFGDRVTVRVNGTWIMSVTDPAPIRSGGIGLGQIWETNGAFDDVVVRALCVR